MWRKTTDVGSVEGQIARRGLPCGYVGTLSLPDWSELNRATTCGLTNLLTELVLEPVCAPLKGICGIIEGNVPVQFIEYIGPGGHDVRSPLLNICMYKGGVERC